MREQQDKRDHENRGWRQGRSKPHRLPCQLCGGLQHPRGRHYSPGHVQLMLAKIERERQRAAGVQQV